MNRYVADTHSLYRYLTNSPLLGINASGVFDEADKGQALIYLPAIILAELYYCITCDNQIISSGLVVTVW